MGFIEPYLNYIIIAVVVITALIALSIIMRAFGGRVRGRKGKRLGVSEYRELDQSRRLMLIRRDNVEHLILVGNGQSLVIEQNIAIDDSTDYASPPIVHRREAPPLTGNDEPEFAPEFAPESAPDPSHQPAPRAPVFGDRAPNVRPIHRDAPRFDSDDGY